VNKGKREETDAKAMDVYDLSCQGMKQKDIALYLGYHPVYVSRLFKRAKDMLRWQADNIDGKYHLGATLKAFMKQEEISLAKMEGLDPNSSVAVGWAKNAQEARKEIKKLLQESGVVFKMPELVEDGADFSDPESRKEYLEWRARAEARRKQRDKGDKTEG
jgi:hypothetical protein